MTWQQARKKLEDYGKGILPLNRAIAVGLKRVEDLELMVQELVDEQETADGLAMIGLRARRLLDGATSGAKARGGNDGGQ